MSNWVSYRNGNYNVFFNTDNGSKLRFNTLSFFEPEFPESFDLKITNSCYHNCSMCHENSKPDGKHSDILNAKFINTLRPYTEIAIGGGNPLEHPDLEQFLYKCKDLNLIPSMTVHQDDFINEIDRLRKYRDEKLLYGFGVSIHNPTEELVKLLKEFPTAVCHLIVGITSLDIIKKLAKNDLKVLLLGYKVFRKGEVLYNNQKTNIDKNIKTIKNILPTMMHDGWFTTISFDNLALTQISPEDHMSKEAYSRFFMGNDGEYTMYIDAVENEFAIGSTFTKRWPVMDNIVDMFNIIKNYKVED